MSMPDKTKEALELVDDYADEYWWFDPDLIIHESMNTLLAERGRLQVENEQLAVKLEIEQEKNRRAIKRLVAISSLKRAKNIVLPDGREFEFYPPDDVVREAWEGLTAAIDAALKG